MEKQKFKMGQIVWTDLTVDEPEKRKEFYKEVFGWKEFPVQMKDGEEEYQDFAMLVDEDTPAGGICTNRGQNKGIPPQWIMYVQVEDVEKSLQKCLDLGGKLLHSNKKKDGRLQYVIVEDFAGAVFGMGSF